VWATIAADVRPGTLAISANDVSIARITRRWRPHNFTVIISIHKKCTEMQAVQVTLTELFISKIVYFFCSSGIILYQSFWLWCRSARTLLHKVANKVLVRTRVRVRVSEASYGATPDPNISFREVIDMSRVSCFFDSQCAFSLTPRLIEMIEVMQFRSIGGATCLMRIGSLKTCENA